MNLERLESLVGSTNLEKIKSLNILIVGIGGVGGYTLESLVRCGVENITIVDFDKVESSNLNRQIISSLTNIGKLKVEVAKERYSNINNKLNLKCLPIFLNKDNINNINIEEYDYPSKLVSTHYDVKSKLRLFTYKGEITDTNIINQYYNNYLYFRLGGNIQ